MKHFIRSLIQAKDDTIPEIQTGQKNKEMSNELYELICDRGKALNNEDLDKVKEINKKIKNRKKWGKKDRVQKNTAESLDTREMHLGINELKTEYQLQNYHFKDAKGKQVLMDERAEYAATHLQKETWEHKHMPKDSEDKRIKSKIVKQKLTFNIDPPPTLEEIKNTYKKQSEEKPLDPALKT